MTLEKIYDGFAEEYENNRGLFDMTEVFASFYPRLNVEKGMALDLGCGAGEPFARWFVDRGWQVTGVDFSTRTLALASRYVPEMETVHADMCQVDFNPASYDVITAIYCLFHVPRNEQPALFRKMYRWLRPGGKGLFTYATREYTGSDEFEGYKKFMGQELFYSHHRPETLYSILREAGFIIEATDYRDIGGEIFLWVTVAKP